MMKAEPKRIDQRHAIVLNLARALASCGLQIDSETMLRELEAMDNFAAARRRDAVRHLLLKLDELAAVQRHGSAEAHTMSQPAQTANRC